MDDTRFWQSVERLEAEFLSDRDEPTFRRKMRRKGFDAATIDERVTAVNEEWDSIYLRSHVTV